MLNKWKLDVLKCNTISTTLTPPVQYPFPPVQLLNLAGQKEGHFLVNGAITPIGVNQNHFF